MKNLDSAQKKYDYQPPTVTVHAPLPPRQISLLTKTAPKSSPGRRILKFLLAVIFLAVIFLSSVVTFKAINLSDKIFVGKKTSFFSKVLQVLKGASGSDSGNLKPVNILLLGIGGEGHDGPYLTDTMMLMQIRPDLKEISLTSIPRDYLVQLPNNLGNRKLNAAFAEGYNINKNYDQAGLWARQAVEKISGLSIPYFAVVDFHGFAKAVDKIGGLDITIDRSFTDYQFPDDFIKDTKGYLPPISFEAGPAHLNGEKALQFARSRHASGPEGSDFARSQRQEKIIQAFKTRVLNLNLFSDANTLSSLFDIFADHFHTNMDPQEIFQIYNFVKLNSIHNFISTSLDPDTHIICPEILPENGAYVLVPCPGKSEQDVSSFFKNSFSLGKLYAEKSIIWMGSSSSDPAIYRNANSLLSAAGLTVWEVNYSKDNFPQTIVYQANPKPATTEYLLNTLNAKEVTLPPPGIKIDKSKVDVIVILGNNN